MTFPQIVGTHDGGMARWEENIRWVRRLYEPCECATTLASLFRFRRTHQITPQNECRKPNQHGSQSRATHFRGNQRGQGSLLSKNPLEGVVVRFQWGDCSAREIGDVSRTCQAPFLWRQRARA